MIDSDGNGKLELEEKEDGDRDIKMEDVQIQQEIHDVDGYAEVLDTMEKLITIYLSFAGMVPNIIIEDDALSCILSIITKDAPYRLLAPLLMLIVLCPQYSRRSSLRSAFHAACRVYDGHPVLDVDFKMMTQHILQDSPQPVLDALRTFTKFSVPLYSNLFHHFI